MSSESTTTTALAEVWNVSKWFGPGMALNGVNLEIDVLARYLKRMQALAG
mgnify:CR=1 FL=1